MPQDPEKDWRRRIPSVDALLRESELCALVRLYGRDFVRVQVTRHLDEARLGEGPGAPDGSTEGAKEGPALSEPSERSEGAPAGALAWAGVLARRIAAERQGRGEGATRRVLNATGVYLHTNLGRAPLEPAVLAEAIPLLDAASDLELDLVTGQRGERGTQAQALLRSATEAEAALVVNNCAGALVLALSALAAGSEVVISRGELVEIGGSFRIPDLILAAGVRLREVGTTNRVRLEDYERAIGPDTAAILRVSPSNFRIRGFTAAVDDAALADLARRRRVLLVADQGSGLLQASNRPELRHHRSLAGWMALGADLACGSADKLLAGPQAGLLVGRQEAIAACARHPWYRALRPGRVTLALLESVLRRRISGEPAFWERSGDEPGATVGDEGRLRLRLERLREAAGMGVIRVTEGFLGGGSAPDEAMIAPALAIETRDSATLDTLAMRLREGDPAVVGTVRDGVFWIDLRTVAEVDDEVLSRVLKCALTMPAGMPAGTLARIPK